MAIVLAAACQAGIVPPASAQAGAGWLSTDAMNRKLDSLEAMLLACEKSDRRFSLLSAIAAAGSVQSGPEAAPPPPLTPGTPADRAVCQRFTDMVSDSSRPVLGLISVRSVVQLHSGP